MRHMEIPQLTPLALVDALNAGPGEPRRDVQRAAEVFRLSERTVYRRIRDYGIRQVYHWEMPEEEAA